MKSDLPKGDLVLAGDLWREVIELLPDSTVILESNLTVRFANTSFRTAAGLSHEDLQGRYFPEITMNGWPLSSLGPILAKIPPPASDTALIDEDLDVSPDGRAIRMRARAIEISGTFVILVRLEDRSEHRRSEQVLVAENQLLKDRLRSAARDLDQSKTEMHAQASRLITNQEEERRFLAQDLHNGVLQRLALVQMGIEQVSRVPALSDPATSNVQISSLMGHLTSISSDLRKLSQRLYPAMLDDLGLSQALDALIRGFREKEDMPATLTRLNLPDHIPANIRLALYHIAEKALHNVSKHAGKTHVRIILEGLNGHLVLEVMDMGEGFDQEDVTPGSGLPSMAERAYLVGGSFEIKSELGRGTSVKVSVPLNQLEAM